MQKGTAHQSKKEKEKGERERENTREKRGTGVKKFR